MGVFCEENCNKYIIGTRVQSPTQEKAPNTVYSLKSEGQIRTFQEQSKILLNPTRLGRIKYSGPVKIHFL